MAARRLLFITERYPPGLGGVAASAGRISRALADLGLEVDVIAWTRSLDPGAIEHRDGNPSLYRMGRFREWDTTMPHASNLCDWLLPARGYHAVWGHYLAPAGFFAVWLGRMHGLPSAVSIRGNDLDRDVFPPGDFARVQWTLHHARSLTAVTRELARKVTAVTGRSGVIHLPNAVDHQVFAPRPAPAGLRERLGIQPDEAVLGFSGELREKKGQRFLFEALRKVREIRPACLLVIGEVRTGLLFEDRVLVTGHLASPEEVNAHLGLCDVYLQPSLWDGMPNALLEAMASGLGCIASDAGGIPEILESGVNGILLPRWQLHRLAEAILEWLDADDSARQRIRRAARATIVERFGFDRERANLQSVLDALLP